MWYLWKCGKALGGYSCPPSEAARYARTTVPGAWRASSRALCAIGEPSIEMFTRADDYVEYCPGNSEDCPRSTGSRPPRKDEQRSHEAGASAGRRGRRPPLWRRTYRHWNGDGTMLRIAESVATKTAISWLTTEEEVAVLRRFGLNARPASRTGCLFPLPAPRSSSATMSCWSSRSNKSLPACAK